MTEVLLLSVDHLVPDPENPRENISDEDVHSMAESIASAGGVDQALIVVPDGDKYRVVDGHMRLEGALLLGDKAPALKCEVRRDLDRRGQLLLMARTSHQHYAKDPISEAKHFRKLIDEHGLSRSELAKAIGTSDGLIGGRLKWLDLEPEIQDHVAKGNLSRDGRVADALLSISDPEARIKTAKMLAMRKVGMKGTLNACQRVKDKLEQQHQEDHLHHQIKNGKAPSHLLASRDLGHDLPTNGNLASGSLRVKAREVCQQCDVRNEVLADFNEPAWTILSHATQETCDACSLRLIRDACQGCPLPELLVRLARTTRNDKEMADARRASS